MKDVEIHFELSEEWQYAAHLEEALKRAVDDELSVKLDFGGGEFFHIVPTAVGGFE